MDSSDAAAAGAAAARRAHDAPPSLWGSAPPPPQWFAAAPLLSQFYAPPPWRPANAAAAVDAPSSPPLPAAAVTAAPSKRAARKKPALRLRNFLCMHPGCGKSFTDNAHLRDHTFVHTGERSRRCAECGRTFARLSTLHDHQRVHSGERPYGCPRAGCDKRYSSRAALRFHVAGHASDDAASSSSSHTARDALMLQATDAAGAAGAGLATMTRLADDTIDLHAKIRTQQTQIAELQAELERLKRKEKKPASASASAPAAPRPPPRASAAAPPMVAPATFLLDGVKPFQCCVCHQRFTNFFQLSFHAKQHPGVSLADVVETQAPLPVGPKYCPEADCEYAEARAKPLKNLQTLKRHWQRRHQAARPFVCVRCFSVSAVPKSFKTRENLKAHEKDCKGGGGGGDNSSQHQQQLRGSLEHVVT